MKKLRLRWAAKCRDCGADRPAGTLAKWYGRGRVYGIDCHDRNGASTGRTGNVGEALRRQANGACAGEVASLVDPYGAYTADGVKIGSGCGCEDYPCCGH